MMPEDGDVHTVLGVLYNLSRDYEKAITSFETALKLKPRDYSLWNKLGATQANSARSADAIYAYQEVSRPTYSHSVFCLLGDFLSCMLVCGLDVNPNIASCENSCN
jgi:tetratricopeptide (TPR) repeat protein